MERLDHGHLNPLLRRAGVWTHDLLYRSLVLGNLAKCYCNSLCYCYSKPLHGCPSVCGTHILRKEQKLKCRITRISMQSLLPNYHLQVMHTESQALAGPCVWISPGSPLWRGLTKFISIPIPAVVWTQANTLAKSYCNSLCYCYLEPLQYFIL